MKVAIYSRGLEPKEENQLHLLLEELSRQDASAIIYKPLAEKHNIQNAELFNTAEDLHPSLDCVISLGGDGTLLDTVTFVQDKNIPVLGINSGRLGLLARIGRE